MQKLAELFPSLSFVTDADTFLKTAAATPLIKQFETRRIGYFEITRLLFSAAGIGIVDGRFIISLNDTLSYQEMAFNIGHELAHTFHYNVSPRPPVLLIPARDDMPLALFNTVEDFCDKFASLWLEQAGADKVVKMTEHLDKCIGKRSSIICVYP